MSNFPLRQKSPTGNVMKSSTQEAALRQQVFHEMNKRRAFLQDNSWIKKRPEEEKDENYGRAVLNRHNSHDALDRKINERDELKATISRYKSDDTLDRTLSTFISPEATKSRPGSLSVGTSSTPASTPAAPVKKKRQSWFPPPPPGYKATTSTRASRRDPAVHPPIPPKPISPVPSPNQLRRDKRQIHSPKPVIYSDTNRSAEGNIRRQDLDNIVKVATSFQKTGKGEELDDIIKMNKTLNRNQGLDGLFRANPKAEQTEKRAKSLESLICMNTQMDKDGKGNQTLDSFIKENPRTVKNNKGGEDLDNIIKVNSKGEENSTGKQDLDGLIKGNPETNKNIKRGQSLDNLIKVTSEVHGNNQGGQSLDKLIKMAPETNRANQRNQDLGNLIKVTPSANKSSEQGLDELINVSPKVVKNTARSQDLDNLIKVYPAMIRSNQSQDLDNLIKVKPSALGNTNREQDPESLIEVNSHMSENKNRRLDGHANGFTHALHKESTRTPVYSYEARSNLSANAGTRHAGPKDTVVYTRTYVENSKSPKDGYQNISGKYIQTVYSTSDRSVIERDMCTYCHKPLGVETKMILDELQICCHSTCFKCEICKQPLENLQAGDSIWIYRQRIHCEPCYSKVIAKWIQ